MFKLIFDPIVILTALMITGYAIFPSLKPATGVIPSPSTFYDISPGNKGNSVDGVKADCYKIWQLASIGLSEDAFNYAMKGHEKLINAKLLNKKKIISIVDFSKPSTQKRLYVIDVSNGKVLFNTWVAHGRNSGNEYAKQFSNLRESHQSSLGFYITMDTYSGGNGYSLRLKGCEKGINDKAYERAIVIHGADYVSSRFIENMGVLGRSYGCPALPVELNKNIINTIKNGSCLFLYHPTKKYCTRSKILNRQA